MKKFKRAQAENRKAIEKHLESKEFLDSSSEEEDSGNALDEAVGKVLSSYQVEGGDTEKTLSYLSEVLQSGGAICLICISSVKKTDAIWNCYECFTFMHLPCIQHWIRDSLTYKREKGINPQWACPKCRTEYKENEIPTKYTCFCGKSIDPPYQPWSIPHSCGESCGKYLQPNCGHKCLLLCHPGPCPPCPKTVTVKCFCGKQPARPRRCNMKEWSCGSICGKKYKSCAHSCQKDCHRGECPPCTEIVLASCNCQAESESRLCNESIWFCDKPCGQRFPCNVHFCESLCHKVGDCAGCPIEKNRTCPCGKKKYSVSCKQQHLPTCGDTCGKLLDCGQHFCNMRCHTEKCGQCLEVVMKTCRCGSYQKEIACTKDFHCNKKCTQWRLCGRHHCNKKCCDCLIKNTFNTCEKVCDNQLNCQKHKCAAPCHSGPCYPCTRIDVIQCRCGSSKITVPCGTVKRIKPPNCNKLCKIPPVCHHPKRESHKCHRGACPPCKKICGLVDKRCGHSCSAICHTKVWTKVKINGDVQPTAPWDNNRKEHWKMKTLPCPPCEVSVMVTCLGGHETLPWPCHKAIPSSCLRECGRLLTCTNHYCEKLCHKVDVDENDENDDDDVTDEDKCMVCEKPCVFPRPKGCTHSCTKVCHPAPCNPCKQLVRVGCHCGINFLYKRCTELTSANKQQKDEILRCGNQCPKNYSCGHRCVDICHSGPCLKEESCNKKVKVWCKCKRLKKDFSCMQIRKGNGIVKCDDVCQKIKDELEKARELEIAKKNKEEELKNQREIEMFEKKFKPKRKMKDRSHQNDKSKSGSRGWTKYWILALLFLIIAFAITYYFIKI